MEILEEIIDFGMENPIALVAVGGALVVVLLIWLWPKGGQVQGGLKRKIDLLQNNFVRLRLDGRLEKGGDLHDLMALPLQQWPHDPYAFYKGALAAVEKMAQSASPITAWPEATADQNVQLAASEFKLLMQAVAGQADPGSIVPKGHVQEARAARVQHLRRMGEMD